MSTDPFDFTEVQADFEKREKAIRDAQAAAGTFWGRLLKSVGRDDAEQIMLGVMGIKKPGAPKTEDAFDRQIRTYLKWLEVAGARKISPMDIAEAILSRPMTERHFGAHGEELEPVGVPMISKDALLQRIRRIRKEMVANKGLSEKYAAKEYYYD